MNRKILIQTTLPGLLIGLLLLGTCLGGAWYLNRLQRDLTRILVRNVGSLQAAQELELGARQLRSHTLLDLIAPATAWREEIDDDQHRFEVALEEARRSAFNPNSRECVAEIEAGYQRFQHELDRLRAEWAATRPTPADVRRLADEHPIRLVVEPCQRLLHLNRKAMENTVARHQSVEEQARWLMIGLGVVGPVCGLILGYGIARGLSRSIYQLSVRVQDMAQHLDHDVGSVRVVRGDGDLDSLDRQLQHVVGRVEEATRRLQAQQRELLRAEQLSAVGRLAASVAHEVRNPLTSVKMLVEAGLRSRQPIPLTADDLRVIHGEVARLEQKVQEFLDFARPPAPQRSRVDLRDLVGQAADLVRARAGQQQVEPELRYPDHPVHLEVDPGQWRTVLVNLLLNALDAMPQGGRLSVTLQGPTAGEVHLHVDDTGPGIPPEMAGRLFTPFASTKVTGTGLGLSISRRIVEEHGGRIQAANRPGGGARFTVTLAAGSEKSGSSAGRDQEAQCSVVSA